jgi:hypothetical protein
MEILRATSDHRRARMSIRPRAADLALSRRDRDDRRKINAKAA